MCLSWREGSWRKVICSAGRDACGLESVWFPESRGSAWGGVAGRSVAVRVSVHRSPSTLSGETGANHCAGAGLQPDRPRMVQGRGCCPFLHYKYKYILAAVKCSDRDQLGEGARPGRPGTKVEPREVLFVFRKRLGDHRAGTRQPCRGPDRTRSSAQSSRRRAWQSTLCYGAATHASALRRASTARRVHHPYRRVVARCSGRSASSSSTATAGPART